MSYDEKVGGVSVRFTLAMARRESRSTRRRLVLYIAAIVLGVAALVAISSFRGSVRSAVDAQARTLLAADLRLDSRWEFPPVVESLVDSMVAAGASLSRVTTFSAMVLAPRSGLTRLFQVRGISGEYPYYGQIETDPPGLWPTFRDSRSALVDPAVLVQLDASAGDTLVIGEGRFVIAGMVKSVPGAIGLRSAIGPRVYIAADYIEETGLLRFGSVAWRLAYLKLGDPTDADAFVEAQDSLLRANHVSHSTVTGRAEWVEENLDRLASFLALVGLVALLLGGVGVASGVHVFVSEKLDTAAVLRCLGARQRQVFGIYLLQAVAMGLIGGGLGAALGIGVQALLPIVVENFLPLDVAFQLEPAAIAAGVAIGLGVAVLFALLPLLRIKDVAPLRALRRDFEKPRRHRDPWRLAAWAALAASLVALTVWQAPEPLVGLAFAAAIAVTSAVLGLTAFALMRIARRFFPRRARYALRQGVANLFRPHNQTVAVTLAIGFGVFLIATLYVVHRNLLDQLVVESDPERPNLLMFDIQVDQAQGVEAILRERGGPVLQRSPIVPARITHLAGRSVEEALADTTPPRIPRWALSREYRHTYRDSLVGSERIIAGEWFTQGDGEAERPGVARISIEESIAEELRLGIGDRITWDIQGVPLETEITSVRSVDWARFETNFFMVFEPGVLEDAPQSLVFLSHVDDPTTRAEIQRDMVLAYPNISIIDLAVILDAIDSVLSKVALAVRFMALFSIASGLVILMATIATSRYQRMRESVLLKTLGARSRLIGRILATEYFALGSFAGLTGVILAAVAGWALTVFLFEMSFRLPGPQLAAFWAGTAALTTFIGLANSRDVVKRTPLAGMRDFAE